MFAIDPSHVVAGALVGLLVGMTGVGGGSLMTPILVLLFGFAPATAVGTDLLFAACTKTVGTAVHGRRGSVDWLIVRRLGSGSIPAAIATLVALGAFGKPDQTAQALVSTVLGGALVLTAAAMLARNRIVAWGRARFGDNLSGERGWQTVVLGAVLGALVAATSVGAGALGVVALLVLYPALPVSRLVGSDIAHAVPLTLVAGIGHWLIGTTDFALLASLLVGSVPAVIVGSSIGSRAGDRVLRPLLAAVLAIVGFKLVL